MAYPSPSGSFVHAAHYASLLLQVSEHLFADQKLFALSSDQRRIVGNETRNLLLQARWEVESKGFVEQFAIAQVGVEKAPPEAVLGDPIPAPKPAADDKGPGQYV